MKQIVVVGAVILEDGRVLCAQRAPSQALAGLWEFPGGKVEVGESPRDALRREISEELGCRVSVGKGLTTTTVDYDFGRVELTTYFCQIVDGRPAQIEHAALQWVQVGALNELAWAPADVPAKDLLVRTAHEHI